MSKIQYPLFYISALTLCLLSFQAPVYAELEETGGPADGSEGILGPFSDIDGAALPPTTLSSGYVSAEPHQIKRPTDVIEVINAHIDAFESSPKNSVALDHLLAHRALDPHFKDPLSLKASALMGAGLSVLGGLLYFGLTHQTPSWTYIVAISAASTLFIKGAAFIHHNYETRYTPHLNNRLGEYFRRELSRQKASDINMPALFESLKAGANPNAAAAELETASNTFEVLYREWERRSEIIERVAQSIREELLKMIDTKDVPSELAEYGRLIIRNLAEDAQLELNRRIILGLRYARGDNVRCADLLQAMK